ncbi:hypothetical protein SAY87_002104 [Trapa incisa]|uniref:Uncharacterized protein n=1 Tax=Trapa incisa TaxID=236973 RepID=A0AAN7JWF7_9MYRT|nr:hypothetical protein SAY87_002104 [Trapa incisa]
MPGTLQISVLDMGDLPPLAVTSPTSITVTMGRGEYPVPKNGEVSIPLTTLREDLIIKLMSGDGQEISHLDIKTRVVVEKGIWDEIFYLEGGGQIHLKLQFVLSEEEKSRIRNMRLSALKKKHGELVSDGSNGLQKAAVAGRDTAIGLSHKQGISGSYVRQEEGPTQDTIATQPFKLQSNANSKVTKSYPDKTEDTSSVIRRKTEASVAESDSDTVQHKMLKESPPEATQIRDPPGGRDSLYSESDLPTTSAKSSLMSYSKVGQDAEQKTVMQGQQGRTPSNVRKMISAFETSLTQEKRPRIKPPPTKLKPSKHEMDVHMSSLQSKEYADERAPKVSPTGGATETDFPSQGTADLEFNKRNIEDLSTWRNQLPGVPKKSIRVEEMGSASVSGRAPGKEKDDENQYCKAKVLTCKTGEMEFLNKHENMVEYSGQGSRGWMFLDELSNFCVTTNRKKIKHLMEDQNIDRGNDQAKRDTTNPRTHKPAGAIIKSDIQMDNKGPDKASAYIQRKPGSDRSAGADPSSGPFGQVRYIFTKRNF